MYRAALPANPLYEEAPVINPIRNNNPAFKCIDLFSSNNLRYLTFSPVV